MGRLCFPLGRIYRSILLCNRVLFGIGLAFQILLFSFPVGGSIWLVLVMVVSGLRLRNVRDEGWTSTFGSSPFGFCLLFCVVRSRMSLSMATHFLGLRLPWLVRLLSRSLGYRYALGSIGQSLFGRGLRLGIGIYLRRMSELVVGPPVAVGSLLPLGRHLTFFIMYRRHGSPTVNAERNFTWPASSFLPSSIQITNHLLRFFPSIGGIFAKSNKFLLFISSTRTSYQSFTDAHISQTFSSNQSR
jgi:hypothetical protein